MKSSIILVLSLLSLSFCTQLESQMASKDFQEIIEDFVEVHKESNHQSDIGLLLARIKSEVISHRKQYKRFIRVFRVSCENSRAKVANFVNHQKEQIQFYQNEANNFNKDAAKAQKDLRENSKSLRSTQKRLKKILEEMAQLIVDYHRSAAESDEKIGVVKQLGDLIEDELINDEKAHSFVQMRNNFNSKLDHLQKLIKKSGDTLYTPILGSLVELASEHNFSDQALLRRIMGLLKKLHQKLVKYRAQKEHDINETLQSLKSQESNLESQIKDYTQLGERYISTVAESHQNVQILESDISDISSEIKRKESELNSLNKLCYMEDKIFKNIINSGKLVIFTLSHAAHLALKI